MEKVVVLIDAGFLSKVSYKLGEGHYFKYDLLKFAKKLAGKQNLIFNHLFFYNAPPYQSPYPSKEEKERKTNYDNFIQKLRQNKEVTIREGRCQRLKRDGHYIYKQKGVDTLITMDLMDMPSSYPKIKSIILIASDSDFVPIIERLKEKNIKVFLHTYFERNRKSNFSTSNELLDSTTKNFMLTKKDFQESRL